MTKAHVHVFDVAEEVLQEVQNTIQKGDIVLVKASRAIGLDRVVDEIQNLA